MERNLSRRNEIRNEILELNEQRKSYITTERKKAGESETLDNAMINTIRDLATKNNFNFEN